MAAPSNLVGRDEQVALLAAAVEDAGAGRGRVVVVRGDPGIGKSALLADLAHRADAAGFEVHSGRGDEMAQARPFGPLTQLLGLHPEADDPDAARIGRILSGQDELDHSGLPLAGEVRFRVLDTVLGLVDAATARRPVALVLDDLHWADEDTLRVVVALAERAATVPLLLAVGTRRHPQAPALVTALRALDDLDATVVEVGPLPAPALADVVASMAGARPGPRLAAEVARAGGNPFLAIELVAAHSSAGALFEDGDTIELAEGRGGSPLGDTALRRLDHLRPETVELLRAASVLGRTFELAVVADLVGRRGISVAADVDEALAAGILHPSGDRLSFVHDLVWEGIYQSLPGAVRTTLHVEAARALADRHADAFDIAAQVDRGAAGAGAEAVPWLLEGAQQVRVTAPATAAGFLTRAIELLPADDTRRPAVQARLAEALVFSGRQRDGHALAEACLRDAGVDEELRDTLGYLLGQALFLEGRLSEAAAQLDNGTEPDSPERAGALADAALALLLGGDLTAAAETAARALTASRAVGDVAVETFVLAVTSWVRALEGDLPGGLALGREAVTRADASGRLEAHRNVPYVFYAQVLLWADHDAEARTAIERATDLGERLGLVWDVPLRHLLRARAHHRRGDWDEAMAEVDAGLSQSHDMGGSVADVWLWCVRARLAVARDDRDAAARALAEAEHGAAEGGQGLDQVAWVSALLAERRGQVDAALATIGLLWDGLEERGLDYYVWDIAPDVVRVALRAGDRDRVDRVLLALEEISARSPDSSAPMVTARCRGMADRDPSAYREALDRLAARKADARPVELALLQVEAADVHEAVRQQAEADALRAKAFPVLEGAGAVAFGVPGLAGPTAVRSTATFGWASLTARELEVVSLLAGSLSNAEIAAALQCSRRTVESHLSHVYTKLGLSSRVQLAVVAAERLRLRDA